MLEVTVVPTRTVRVLCAAAIFASSVAATGLQAGSGPRAMPAALADDTMQQFLAMPTDVPPYRAWRRLDAHNRGRAGWMEVSTEFSPSAGFTYTVLAEGGSGIVRSRVLRALLEGEREMIARGETARSALALTNYGFAVDGMDDEGFARVLLKPKRKDGMLMTGAMMLRPETGELVRLEGRLAKNPSFWVKNVDIVRSYQSVHGAVVPVKLNSTAQLRFLGAAVLSMSYRYLEINGHPVAEPE